MNRKYTDPDRKKARKAAETRNIEELLHFEKTQRRFIAEQRKTGGGPPPRPPTPPHPDLLSQSHVPNPKYDLLPMSFSSQVSFPSLSFPDPPLPVFGLKQPVKDILSTVCDRLFED